MMTKKDYRIYARSQLGALTAETRIDYGSRLVQKLLAHPLWSESNEIYLFCPMISEPDISPLATSALESGKTVGVAVIGPDGLFFRRVSTWAGPDWHRNRYGIPEPESGKLLEPVDVFKYGHQPLILVPGLLFTPGGNRLGRGGGFFDRWLAAYGGRCLKIGMAFSCQIISEIPVDDHDMTVDMICTEQGIMTISR